MFVCVGLRIMPLNYGAIEEFTFTDQDNLASACSNTLRKVKSLSDIVPVGRLFGAITSLAETADDAELLATVGALRAASHKLKQYSDPATVTDIATPLPINVRKRG